MGTAPRVGSSSRCGRRGTTKTSPSGRSTPKGSSIRWARCCPSSGLRSRGSTPTWPGTSSSSPSRPGTGACGSPRSARRRELRVRGLRPAFHRERPGPGREVVRPGRGRSPARPRGALRRPAGTAPAGAGGLPRHGRAPCRGPLRGGRGPLRPRGRRAAQRHGQGDRLAPAVGPRGPPGPPRLRAHRLRDRPEGRPRGVAVLAAISAPTSLAVELAEATGLRSSGSSATGLQRLQPPGADRRLDPGKRAARLRASRIFCSPLGRC